MTKKRKEGLCLFIGKERAVETITLSPPRSRSLQGKIDGKRRRGNYVGRT